MLAVDHLTRSFGELIAVDDVSFTVPDGKTIGFVGGMGYSAIRKRRRDSADED